MGRLLRMIEKGFTYLAITSAFIMVCLTSADALGRYFLNQPISGVYEITEKYLMVFIVYFALAYAYRQGANIRVTMLVSRLPSRAKLGINYFAQIFSILFIGSLFASATRINLARLGEVVELTRKWSLPLWPAYLVVSAGLVVMGLLVFLDLWQVRKGKSALFKEDSSEGPIRT